MVCFLTICFVVQGGFLAADNKSDTRSEFEQSVATFGLAGPCDCQRRRLDPRCSGHLQDDPAGCWPARCEQRRVSTPFFLQDFISVEGARASALNLNRGDLSCEPSEENRSAPISNFVSCMYLQPFVRATLTFAGCLQRCAEREF